MKTTRRALAILATFFLQANIFAHFGNGAVNIWLDALSIYRAWAVTTRYVSPSGSGSTCSDASPCSALTGIGQTASCDVLIWKDGTYTTSLEAVNIAGCSDGNYTLMKAQNRRAAHIRPTSGNFVMSLESSNQHHIEFDGLHFDGSGGITNHVVKITWSGAGESNHAHHIRFRDVEINSASVAANGFNPTTGILGGGGGFGSGLEVISSYLHDFGYGIYWGGPTALVEKSEFLSGTGFALHWYCDAGCNTGGAVLRWNKIKNMGGNSLCNAAIVFASGAVADIYGNTIRDTGGPCGIAIQLYGNSSLVKVYNNSAYSNNGPCVDVNPGHSSSIVRNNLCSENGSAIVDNGTGTVQSNNLTGSASALFVDAANDDFRLKSGASAIGAGLDLGSPYDVDIVGSTRVAPWDVGAYAFTTGGTPSCPSPALVASYAADGNSNDGTGINHGSSGSGVTFSAGKYGNAWTLDGTGGISIADAAALDFSVGFSLGAWVKPSSVASDAIVIVKNPDSKYFLFSSISGYCGAGMPMGGFSQGGTQLACYGTQQSVGVWSYLEVSYAPPLITLRKDGTVVSTAAATATLDATAGSLQIGTSGFGEHFTGQIDNVRIYNCGISLAQHIADMNTPLGTLTAPINFRLSGATIKIGPSVTVKLGGQ